MLHLNSIELLGYLFSVYYLGFVFGSYTLGILGGSRAFLSNLFLFSFVLSDCVILSESVFCHTKEINELEERD